MKNFHSHSAAETREIARSFSRSLTPGTVVALKGTLGSGKTQFVIGACEGLRVTVRVSSPTFTFINEYGAPFGVVAHIDLYRIEDSEAIDQIGVEEYFSPRFITFIEWPEIIFSKLPDDHLLIEFQHGRKDHDREIVVKEVHRVTA